MLRNIVVQQIPVNTIFIQLDIVTPHCLIDIDNNSTEYSPNVGKRKRDVARYLIYATRVDLSCIFEECGMQNSVIRIADSFMSVTRHMIDLIDNFI